MYKMCRKWAEPKREMWLGWVTLVPEVNWVGVNPTKATSLRAVANRRTEPNSARSRHAVRTPIPGMLVKSESSYSLERFVASSFSRASFSAASEAMQRFGEISTSG